MSFHALSRALLIVAVVATLFPLLERNSAQTPAVSAAPSCPAPAGATIEIMDFPADVAHGRIQAAIDCFKLPDGTNNPGKVHIPAGTHNLPEKVRVRSGIELYGDGMDVTILRWASGVSPDNMMSNSTISGGNRDIIIRDLTLSGNGQGSGDCCHGLRLIQVDNVLVRKVAADGFSKDGFYLGYYVNKPEKPGVYNSRLSECRARNNSRMGIALTRGSGNIIDRCLFEGNNQDERLGAVDFEPDDGLTVTSNKVVGNTFRSNQNNGLQYWAVLGPVSNNVACYNSFISNRGTAIHDNNGTSNTFVGNTYSGNGGTFVLSGNASSTAKVGDQYASACAVALLPGQTPIGPPTSGTPTPTPTPTSTATPTRTPTPGPSGPAAPTGLTATAVSSSQINLSWTDNASDESGFAIERCQGSGCSSFAQIATVGANATSYQSTGLTAATGYTYRVRALKGTPAVYSSYSNTASASTTAATSGLAAPTNLVATGISGTQINLSWTESAPDEDGYDIERCSGNGCSSFSRIGSVGRNATSYSNTRLSSGTSYTYRLRAFKGCGDDCTQYGSYSGTATATAQSGSPTPTPTRTPTQPPGPTATPTAGPPPPTGAPVAPVNLTALRITNSQINLTWQHDSANTTRFRIERCRDSGCSNFSLLTNVAAGTTSYLNTGLSGGKYYTYRVRAENSATNSAYSNLAGAWTTSDGNPPPPPPPE